MIYLSTRVVLKIMDVRGCVFILIFFVILSCIIIAFMETFYRTKFGVYPYHRKMGDEKTSVEHLHPYSSKEMATQIK